MPVRILTTKRRPSQSAVLNDWTLAGGLPGNTARIEAVGLKVGLSLRSKSHYTIFWSNMCAESDSIFSEEVKRRGFAVTGYAQGGAT